MSEKATPLGNGVPRRVNGQFEKGSHGGPGAGRMAEKVARLKQAILEAVTPEALAKIIIAQVKKAQDGDTESAKFLCDRVMGKAAQDVNLAGKDGGSILFKIFAYVPNGAGDAPAEVGSEAPPDSPDSPPEPENGGS